MNKKAFVKTLEVLFAIVITFIFLVFIVPDRFLSSPKEQTFNYLTPLEMDQEFRDIALSTSEGCYYDINTTLTNTVEDLLPPTYNYSICVSDDPYYLGGELPDEKVYTNNLVIATNSTDRGFVVVRLFYWVIIPLR